MRQLETLKEEVSRGVLHHYRTLMRNSGCLQFKGRLGDFFPPAFNGRKTDTCRWKRREMHPRRGRCQIIWEQFGNLRI